MYDQRLLFTANCASIAGSTRLSYCGHGDCPTACSIGQLKCGSTGRRISSTRAAWTQPCTCACTDSVGGPTRPSVVYWPCNFQVHCCAGEKESSYVSAVSC